MRGFLQPKARLMKKKRRKMIMIDDNNPNQDQDHHQQPLQPDDGVDRLSDLPIDIRRLILSLLPSKDAVRTAALSSSWRRPILVPRIDSLVLDAAAAPAVNNPVLLRRLEIPSLAATTASLPRAALRDLVLGHGLQDLVVGRRSPTLPLSHPLLPKLVLRSRSLRFLTVRFCRMPLPWVTCSLTNLKTLKLKGVLITDSLLFNIVSSCPFLSLLKLVLCELLRVCRIHSPSLKHLVLRPSKGLVKIDIDAPSMKTLILFTWPTVETLAIRAPKVRKAYLHLAFPERNRGIGLKQFLAGSPELVRLSLRGMSTALLLKGNDMGASYPMLKSLSLRMDVRHDIHMLVLLKLLESCPYLQNLNLSLVSYGRAKCVLKEYAERVKRLPCLHNHLEQVEISELKMWECEKELAEPILHGAKALKKMVLNLPTGCSDQDMVDAKKLLSSRKGYIQELRDIPSFRRVQLNLK